MIEMKAIHAWRYVGRADVEVLTAEGWVPYSTGPNVERELAELKAAGIPRAADHEE